MLEKLYNFFENRNHKEVMLSYMYVTIVFILIIAITVNLFREYYMLLDVTTALLFIFAIGFYFYRKSKLSSRVDVYFTLIVISSDLVLGVIVFKENFLNYSTVFPLLITFGIFYFYRLKPALIMSLIHNIYWIVIYIYGYLHYPDNPLLHNPSALMGLIISYFFMNMFGFAYYISNSVYQMRLEQSNQQKSLLLGEVHHRVKNNLNIMVSILGLQEDKKQNPEINHFIEQNILRIKSMALVHELLYQHDNLGEIDFRSYTQKLAQQVLSISQYPNTKVTIKAEKIFFDSDDIIHLGIILNEFISNSIKYAFHDKQGYIDISLIKKDKQFILTYQDSGKEFNPNKKGTKGFGLQLIELSSQQLDGSLEFCNSDSFCAIITFEGS